MSVRALTEKVEETRSALQEHEEAFSEVIERWFELAGEYNASISQAKAAIRSSVFSGKSKKFGAFTAIKAVKRTYDPEILGEREPEAFLKPGVVKQVNREVVEELVRRGEIRQSAAAAAYKEDVSIRVNGPKILELKL